MRGQWSTTIWRVLSRVHSADSARVQPIKDTQEKAPEIQPRYLLTQKSGASWPFCENNRPLAGPMPPTHPPPPTPPARGNARSMVSQLRHAKNILGAKLTRSKAGVALPEENEPTSKSCGRGHEGINRAATAAGNRTITTAEASHARGVSLDTWMECLETVKTRAVVIRDKSIPKSAPRPPF